MTIYYKRYTYCLNNPLKYSDPSGYRYTYQDYQREKAGYASQSGESQFFNNYVGWWHDLQKSYSEGAWQYYVSSSFTKQFPNATFNVNPNVSRQDLGTWVPLKQTEFGPGGMTPLGYCTGDAQITQMWVPYVTFSQSSELFDKNDGPSITYKKAWSSEPVSLFFADVIFTSYSKTKTGESNLTINYTNNRYSGLSYKVPLVPLIYSVTSDKFGFSISYGPISSGISSEGFSFGFESGSASSQKNGYNFSIKPNQNIYFLLIPLIIVQPELSPILIP